MGVGPVAAFTRSGAARCRTFEGRRLTAANPSDGLAQPIERLMGAGVLLVGGGDYSGRLFEVDP